MAIRRPRRLGSALKMAAAMAALSLGLPACDSGNGREYGPSTNTGNNTSTNNSVTTGTTSHEAASCDAVCDNLEARCTAADLGGELDPAGCRAACEDLTSAQRTCMAQLKDCGAMDVCFEEPSDTGDDGTGSPDPFQDALCDPHGGSCTAASGVCTEQFSLTGDSAASSEYCHNQCDALGMLFETKKTMSDLGRTVTCCNCKDPCASYPDPDLCTTVLNASSPVEDRLLWCQLACSQKGMTHTGGLATSERLTCTCQ